MLLNVKLSSCIRERCLHTNYKKLNRQIIQGSLLYDFFLKAEKLPKPGQTVIGNGFGMFNGNGAGSLAASRFGSQLSLCNLQELEKLLMDKALGKRRHLAFRITGKPPVEWRKSLYLDYVVNGEDMP
jgi:hypothetical protein